MKNKRGIGILIAIVILLSVPLIAMQFTTEVNWTMADFVIMGFLLLSTGLICKLVMRKVTHKNSRIGIVATVLLLLFLVWAELAVGVFGTPFAGS